MTSLTIPARLKLMRQRLGITQAEAAAALGAPLRTYQQWEAGRRAPATPEIIDLACAALEAQTHGTAHARAYRSSDRMRS